MIKEVYILAGGKSSRMGTDKGLMLIQGKPMIAHLLDKLDTLNWPITIVSSNQEYDQFGKKRIEDIIPGKGPLSGLQAILSETQQERVMVIPCDYPFIEISTLEYIWDVSSKNDVTYPKIAENSHHLIGVYSKKCLPTITWALENDLLKLKEVLNRVDVREIAIESNQLEEFKNLNSIIDL